MAAVVIVIAIAVMGPYRFRPSSRQYAGGNLTMVVMMIVVMMTTGIMMLSVISHHQSSMCIREGRLFQNG